MKIEPFAMERLQSTWEHRVEINLSESGVEPLTLGELLEGSDREAIFDEPLLYSQSNGTDELRRAVADLYPGADLDQVEITVGCAEANYLVMWSLVEPGDEVVMMAPNYGQTWGLARGFGAEVEEWVLEPDAEAGRWRGDLGALEELVGPRTRLILLTNPNNPTGSCLTAEELDQVVRIAERHGTWIVCDEVYRGAEVDGVETASMWGRGERVIVTGGLSKAYGLPGLRIGWIVAPPGEIAALWSRHDYTTIAPAALSDHLARLALEPRRRRRLLERTRGILETNLAVVSAWLDDHRDTMSYLPPQAGAIVYLSYQHPVGSMALVERLRDTKSVLVVPGDHFRMDGHLRIGFGSRTDHLETGLARIDEVLRELKG